LTDARVVVVGGFGNFGARICRRLAAESGIELVATGRELRDRALPGVGSAQLDTQSLSFARDLAALKPAIVIHCAGPFQGQDYRVAEATLDCGAHYLDLADGRAFVARFAAALDGRARVAGRTAISGASTLPALSSAVIDHLKSNFTHVETIEIAIAPGQHGPRGTATMAAVLGYAGHGFMWWINGEWETVHGWQDLVRLQFPFGKRWAAACDIPDLELFPEHYAGVKTVTFRAALEVPVQHWALWSLAAMRRSGMPLPLERWAGGLNRVGSWLDRFGSDCGGMRVDLIGESAEGRRKRRTWLLTARGNHGPEIPCMAAVLLAVKLARGEPVPTGARPCMGLLRLADFESEFSRWDITTQFEVLAE
jgi:NAD(P)-dependent dehydrogenase (short-subunit alcohol dehydrogenase family)